MRPPVLIVGGGIGGLALGACLRHRKIPFLLYERAPELKEVGAAMGVWPNATRVLHHLNILEPLARLAHPTRAGELRTASGKVLKHLVIPPSDIPGIAAHRADLLNTLRSALPADSIHLSKSATALEHDPATRQLRVQFADGSWSPWSNALVGADGINSVIRQLTLHDGPPTYRGYIAWRGVAQFSGELTIGESWGRGQRFGLVPLGQNRVGWWATANKPEAAATVDGGDGSQADWKKEILARYGSWHDPIPEILRATPESAILCNAIADRDPRQPWGNANTTLLGDAAHPTTPNLGQGACMAIEDAAVLAYTLAAIHDIPTAFRVYEATRHSRTAFIVRESRKFGRVGQWQNSVACSLRNFLTRFASDRSLRKQFDDLWAYDAWNPMLVMPPGFSAQTISTPAPPSADNDPRETAHSSTSA